MTRTQRRRGSRGAVGDKGPKGLPGPQGPRGAAGGLGPRGKTGAAGKRGPKGIAGPHEQNRALEVVEERFGDVFRQLDIQLRRIAQMQVQLDELARKIARGVVVKAKSA
jgi:hypothetical protein